MVPVPTLRVMGCNSDSDGFPIWNGRFRMKRLALYQWFVLSIVLAVFAVTDLFIVFGQFLAQAIPMVCIWVPILCRNQYQRRNIFCSAL